MNICAALYRTTITSKPDEDRITTTCQTDNHLLYKERYTSFADCRFLHWARTSMSSYWMDATARVLLIIAAEDVSTKMRLWPTCYATATNIWLHEWRSGTKSHPWLGGGCFLAFRGHCNMWEPASAIAGEGGPETF